ncbi:MAG: thermonuclease family protein [Isosphaeraceae bacterium]
MFKRLALVLATLFAISLMPADAQAQRGSRGGGSRASAPGASAPSTSRSYGGSVRSRQSDNLLVNKEIIRQGYGHDYVKYPFDPARMEEFRAAERIARSEKRGLWASGDH